MRRQSNRAVPSLLTKKAIFIVPIPFNTLRHAGIRATRPTNIYIYRPRQKQNPKKLSPDGKTGETKTPCGVRNCTLRQVLEYSAASTQVPLTRFLSSPSLPASGKKSIFVGKSVNTHMNIFDDYKDHKGEYAVSPSLLWEYDLSAFDWWKSRKTVVAAFWKEDG